MSNCGKIEYSGKCIVGGEVFRFARAVPADAAKISVIYEKTRIDRNNYRIRLSDTDPRRFEKTGGMFIVMDEHEISEEISKENGFWALFHAENGDIAGSFWFSEENEYYKGLSYEHMEKCIYPREVVVSVDHTGKFIGRALYLTCAMALMKAGYERGAADLYRVLKYETAEGEFFTDQTNIPSQMAVRAIGAEFAEPLPRRVISLDGLNVTIEPQMYIFDYAKIADVCERAIAQRDIQIIWE